MLLELFQCLEKNLIDLTKESFPLLSLGEVAYIFFE